MLSDGRSTALVTSTGEIDWWCAPGPDDPPLLWSLLDRDGAACRWTGTEHASRGEIVAGPSLRSVVRVAGRRVHLRDGLVMIDGGSCLVRLVRSEEDEVPLSHELAVGGFDRPWGVAGPGVVQLDGLSLCVEADGPAEDDGRWTRHRVVARPDRWQGVVVALGGRAVTPDEAAEALDRAEAQQQAQLASARLPRHHPGRGRQALEVLDACTYRETGAVLAAATTSLPEAIGADRQFDYRYSWLRDTALAVSVESLLGRGDRARRHLAFLVRAVGDDIDLRTPVVDVRGGPIPVEREVPGVEGWHGSRPVRVGNDAAAQLQYDAWGLVIEAVSVHLQTGGSLDDGTWALVRTLADRFAADDTEPSHGIWEFREEKDFVSGDIGRWLVLDRALWIARGWRPWHRRRHWKRTRDEVKDRVLASLEDGRLPQVYDEPYEPDASALMVPVFGMLDRHDPRAHQLIDRVIADLGAGPYLYRYRRGRDDGFHGAEGAFLPMSWWAVSALAVTGRVDEARSRADWLCASLPALVSEEADTIDGTSLGNVPLVWSHMEMARALYVLDAADLRDRFGAVGLWMWRLSRFAALRWRAARSDTHRPSEVPGGAPP